MNQIIWIKFSGSNYIWIKSSGSNYIWIKLSGSNYLDQIIWIKLSGSNYLDQIIWIKLSRSNFISIFMSFSYHFSYQFTRIIRNSENHSNQEKFENVITKLNQNIQNNQMQFRILWIPRNFSRSKILTEI